MNELMNNHYLFTSTVILTAVLSTTCLGEDSAGPQDRSPVVLTDQAREIHSRAIVIDGHNDLPWELRAQGSLSFTRLDISQHQDSLQTDIPRLRKGDSTFSFGPFMFPPALLTMARL